ncbi:hypothetical protein Aspvir_002772 [Aspergillus viridinutans]|uniref:DUF6546 domain-containing protein n=1 Tax=Aspergillus viridinutans TaxID=75553 RepID=A0A9P3C3V7_ASPVI|nr:uncharacterized protein Aspvir_002772 [Aspergillus viridinutans]GIK07117.1 hypothetical protein Aspvir_002772 [Aspergillus viridinutans]
MWQYWLPLEIVISYLDVATNSSLVPYATVSREWQACIEQRTFAKINLNDPQRLEEFRQIVACNKQKRIYVQEIHLLIPIEPYDIKAHAYFETVAEHNRNNKIFVQTIQNILQILATWPENQRGIKLFIQAQSPSDPIRGDKQRLKRARYTPHEDLLDRRFERSYLQVSEEDLKRLPPVVAVTTLVIYGGMRFERLIRPSATAVIASKMPRLQIMAVNLKDNEKRDQELRKRDQDDFANSFHLMPPSVRRFNLVFYNEAPRNEAFQPINLVEGKIEDLFSAQLRAFSQQLTSLSLDSAVIGKELFWPVNDDGNPQLPYWPNLTILSLDYQPTSPSGEWYFERDPNEDLGFEVDEREETLLPDYLQPAPEDQRPRFLRSKASVKLIQEFYISAGRAAQRMPRLQYMDLKCSPGLISHQFEYQVEEKGATATWTDLAGYAPEECVVQAWRDAAFEHTGMESSLEVKLVGRTGTT